MTGELSGSGPELYRLGVVEDCTAPEELLAESLAIAREISAKSPMAVKLAKHALNQIEEMSLRDGYRFEQSMTGELTRRKRGFQGSDARLRRKARTGLQGALKAAGRELLFGVTDKGKPWRAIDARHVLNRDPRRFGPIRPTTVWKTTNGAPSRSNEEFRNDEKHNRVRHGVAFTL